MPPTPRRRRSLIAVLAAAILLAGLAVGVYFLWSRPGLPGPESARYREYVENFQVGLAALDTERSLEIGGEKLDRAIQIIPQEPAAWADRGLMYLRDHQKERAAADFAKAHELAPECGEVEALLGWLARDQGAYGDAVGHFRKAVEVYPRNLRYLYALADAVLQQGGPDADAEYQRLIEQGLKVQPNNLFLLRERLGTAVRRGDRAAVDEVVARFKEFSTEWNEAGREELAKFVKAAGGPLPGEALDAFYPLSNTLASQRGYPRSLEAAFASAGLEGEPVTRLLRLAPMPPDVAPPDLGLTFTPEPLGQGTADAAWVVWLTGGQECTPAVYNADAATVRRADAPAPPMPFPGGPKAVAPSAHGLVAADFDNDFRTDFLLAGAGGLRLWRQGDDGAFTDVTEKTGLPADVLGGDYYGAWSADVEMDGDLDFIVAPRTGAPFVLRNNGDGTFKALKDLFPGVADVRDFAWADFNHDGAPDGAFLGAGGQLAVFLNQRRGLFTASPLPAATADGLALAAADVNDDGVIDLLILGADGVLRRLSHEGDDSWAAADLGQWDIFSQGEAGPGAFRLLTADLDNNGALDLVAAGPVGARIWMGYGPDKFRPLAATVSERLCAVADLPRNGRRDGRLDLLGLTRDGRPFGLYNNGQKNYHYQEYRPNASKGELGGKGDNRVNSFGVGAEAEVRTGLLVQKQVVAGPVVHFGLGQHEVAQVLRIVWPNGDAQVEFAEAAASPCVVVQQRLKGSCPFLFTWDGKRMQFVADVLWSSPLGLYINAQDRGAIAQTTDWVKVRGDQLRPRDGFYDVRLTADLWETHFFDHVHLTVVDHPADTEMFVDERFFLTKTEPQLYMTRPPHPVARATDDNGADVTDVVRRADGRYLDTFGRGKFQGVTRDHYVEVDLGDDAPKTGPVYLLATGWIHPTDSSLNAAIEQGKNEPPHGLVLEVPDGKGGWTVGLAALGFPAGKNKTIVIRLDDPHPTLPQPGGEGREGGGVARRFRLRTNMEIYWDALEYAEGLDAPQTRQIPLQLATAELRHRGISRIARADASSPELPDYDKLVSRGQYWRDLVGYCTRYGDVRELLEKSDDRCVIMNAGDEIALRFAVPEGPRPGWKRDFVWASDGWEKDGDFNTRFSKTVLPLPYHGMTDYETPPGRLEDDPVYRRFPDDWKKYHRRYVTPDVFERGLRPLSLDQP